MIVNTPLMERFPERIGVDADTGCHVWTGRTDRDGYGLFKEDGRDVRAHRAAWAAAYGRPAPRHLVVRHTCHRPSCVNPEHLRLGAPRDNVLDRDAAGRQAKGSRNGRAVLDEQKIAALKRVLADGFVPRGRLARLLGVDPTTVRDIERGRIWGDVEPE